MDAEAEFALELGRVSRRWRARLDERLKHTGLTQSRWSVLLSLSKSGPLSQRELAERVGIEGPTLVRVLDKLEKQDLLERHVGHDRRVKVVRVTDAAGPILDEIMRIAAALRHEVLAGVSPADLAVARGVMQAIADNLERH